MRVNYKVLPVAWILLSASLPVQAAQPVAAATEVKPSASVPASATLHRKFKDRQEADGFVELLSLKQTTLTQIDVMSALIREKQAELGKFGSDLDTRFGLQPGGDYEFNAETKWIVQVTTITNAQGGGTTNKVEKKPLRRLDKDEDVRDFVRMAMARNVTREQISVFAMVTAEKNLELQQCDIRLLDRYGISNKSAYQYVAADLSVYKLGTNSSAAAGAGNNAAVPR